MKIEDLDRCFCCNIELATSCGDEKDWPATIFEATGNWGSTVFDPFNGESRLIIRICDKCVVKKQHKIVEIGNDLQRELRDEVAEYFEEIDFQKAKSSLN